MVWAKDWGWSKPQLTDKRATHRRKCRAKRPLSTGRPSMDGEARAAGSVHSSAVAAAPDAAAGARRRLCFGV